MDEIYGPHEYADRALMSPDDLILYQQYDHDNSLISSDENHQPRNTPALRFDESVAAAAAAADHVGLNRGDGDGDDDDHQEGAGECSSVIKSRIAAHPSYPKLLDAYIDCQKVGAAPEMACLLEEIRLEKDWRRQDTLSICLGGDPELDDFMETYCEMLVKYKWDLSRPFDEATSFLNSIEAQLLHLCNDDNIALPSDEELSRGATQIRDVSIRIDDQQLKHKLFERYGKHINHLKREFSKKKKKGKLPKEAKQIMLQWWNSHCNWPYPTEADKTALGESTGLDQKQINNWFINQRKRHWKSPENMQLAISGDPSTLYFAGKD